MCRKDAVPALQQQDPLWGFEDFLRLDTATVQGDCTSKLMATGIDGIFSAPRGPATRWHQPRSGGTTDTASAARIAGVRHGDRAGTLGVSRSDPGQEAHSNTRQHRVQTAPSGIALQDSQWPICSTAAWSTKDRESTIVFCKSFDERTGVLTDKGCETS